MPLLRSLTLTRKSHRSIEDAVGNAFLQLLAETNGQGQDQRCVLQSPFLGPPPTYLLCLLCPSTALYRCVRLLTSSSNVSPNNEIIQAFAKDVRRRKEEPPGNYDGFIDLAASAAVRVLVYGPNSPDE